MIRTHVYLLCLGALTTGLGACKSTDKAATSDNPLTVVVNDEGYEPTQLTVPQNQPFEVTFIRTSQSHCGEEVVFPDHKIRKTLPLNEPVTIALPAQEKGDLGFTCGMSMMRGALIVR